MFAQFLKDKGGNYTAIFATVMVPVMAGLAGVVDFVGTSNSASKLQDSLDATAIAIATRYDPTMAEAEAHRFGSGFFAANLAGAGLRYEDGQAGRTSDTVTDFHASLASVGQGVEISVGAMVTHQGLIGGSKAWHATRRSNVRILNGQPACMLTLDKHASGSVLIKGSSQVRLDGCLIAANSDAAASISRVGAGQLSAACVTTAGGTEGLSTSRTDLDCGAPLERQYPSIDPLAGIGPPAYTACRSLPNSQTKALSPGTYCNRTWDGDITLASGTYILRGGEIKLGGNGRLAGHGVTIFLMDGAEMVVNGNEIVELSPPTSGPFAGVTIYQERGNAAEVKITGGSGSRISGFIYAPSAHVLFAGNSDMSGAGDCVRIISNTLEMTGNSAIRSDCEAELGGRAMHAGRRIVLMK